MIAAADSWVFEVLARAIGLVFAYAAYAKLRNVGAFIAALRTYRIIGASFSPLAGCLLIAGEMAIAASHLTFFALPYMVSATIALLSVFIGYSAVVVWRGERQRCLCFGADQQDHLDGRTIARTGVLLAGEVVLLGAASFGFGATLVPWQDSIVEFVATIAAALPLVMIVIWCLSIPDVVVWWRLRRPEAYRSTLASTDPLLRITKSAGQ